MKSIFRVVFYLRSNYVNKEGKTPVMLRIYLNNERLSIGFTGIAVKLSQWDKEKERLKGRNTEVLNTKNRVLQKNQRNLHLLVDYALLLLAPPNKSCAPSPQIAMSREISLLSETPPMHFPLNYEKTGERTHRPLGTIQFFFNPCHTFEIQ